MTFRLYGTPGKTQTTLNKQYTHTATPSENPRGLLYIKSLCNFNLNAQFFKLH